ncbi:MAG: glutaminyl-peptide cyclotransferase, partial [Gammaproteobacteria bacterium]
ANLFGEGLAAWSGQLWQLTWREGRVLVWEQDSFRPLREISYEGEGWGLTLGNGMFYMSDGSDLLFIRNPADFSVTQRVKVCDSGAGVKRLNELEWIAGSIWANVWRTSRIAIVDPTDGNVRSWLDLSHIVAREAPAGGVLNGIAWDRSSGEVWVTGKMWSHMYRITGYPGEEKRP